MSRLGFRAVVSCGDMSMYVIMSAWPWTVNMCACMWVLVVVAVLSGARVEQVVGGVSVLSGFRGCGSGVVCVCVCSL